MFKIEFAPEIERRLAAGNINDDFVLHAAQVLYPIEGPRVIRLNEEVRGVVNIKVIAPSRGEIRSQFQICAAS
jgi:hypothetical protein